MSDDDYIKGNQTVLIDRAKNVLSCYFSECERRKVKFSKPMTSNTCMIKLEGAINQLLIFKILLSKTSKFRLLQPGLH